MSLHIRVNCFKGIRTVVCFFFFSSHAPNLITQLPLYDYYHTNRFFFFFYQQIIEYIEQVWTSIVVREKFRRVVFTRIKLDRRPLKIGHTSVRSYKRPQVWGGLWIFWLTVDWCSMSHESEEEETESIYGGKRTRIEILAYVTIDKPRVILKQHIGIVLTYYQICTPSFVAVHLMYLPKMIDSIIM